MSQTSSVPTATDDPGLNGFDSAPADDLLPVLTELSGSGAWARAVLAGRPYNDRDALHTAARRVLAAQSDAEVSAAVDAHPPIGARGPMCEASAREQSAASGADADTTRRLAEGQQRYTEHFGYGFLICATGLSAEQILAELDRRLAMTPEQDLAATREHLARINALRLDRLLEEGSL
ncbi:2-oxo-4-hydroxy-4-carboxy-5-ureidoimidazoline decarboxylase [Dietzia cinnamea]|uniref:2-oxo-4-hydroxy-4-carboxy-5-ureidoimidazoline decarboxylase n=1 Tax=Dietzia cinnamea TaxID=321318 RepID=UPI000D622933|nr:2-oxo-4-hydroxy-4-carboxy-5-ureidoimidazoline decarboxylase [Dietzia cinnamea]PWD95434.1 2-oxo-4-hydroxy-4-carboxy-5-ureidoimidazoline decarboxylase [Dietzia maris]